MGDDLGPDSFCSTHAKFHTSELRDGTNYSNRMETRAMSAHLSDIELPCCETDRSHNLAGQCGATHNVNTILQSEVGMFQGDDTLLILFCRVFLEEGEPDFADRCT